MTVNQQVFIRIPAGRCAFYTITIPIQPQTTAFYTEWLFHVHFFALLLISESNASLFGYYSVFGLSKYANSIVKSSVFSRASSIKN